MSFDDDVVVSQMNEYEVLQLLMGECRERLQEYSTTYEEEIKINQVCVCVCVCVVGGNIKINQGKGD